MILIIFTNCTRPESKEQNRAEQVVNINTRDVDDIFNEMSHGNVSKFEELVKNKSKDNLFKFEKEGISLIIYSIKKLNNNVKVENMISFLINNTNIIKDTRELNFL